MPGGRYLPEHRGPAVFFAGLWNDLFIIGSLMSQTACRENAPQKIPFLCCNRKKQKKEIRIIRTEEKKAYVSGSTSD